MAFPLDRTLIVLGSALVLATGAVACGSDKQGASSGSTIAAPGAMPAAATDRVVIKDFKYGPVAAQAKVGSTVTFVNNDNAEHTATSKAAGAFDSGTIKQGQKKTLTLKKAGTFTYYCAFHPFMKGEIKVVG